MKDQGHQAWHGLVPLKDPTGALLREQLCYVDGYMLMADDLFRELNKIEQEKMWSPEARELLRRIRHRMHGLRGGAKATEKLLLKASDEHEPTEASPEAQLGEGLEAHRGGGEVKKFKVKYDGGLSFATVEANWYRVSWLSNVGIFYRGLRKVAWFEGVRMVAEVKDE
jgi:hypothetical protein